MKTQVRSQAIRSIFEDPYKMASKSVSAGYFNGKAFWRPSEGLQEVFKRSLQGLQEALYKPFESLSKAFQRPFKVYEYFEQALRNLLKLLLEEFCPKVLSEDLQAHNGA